MKAMAGLLGAAAAVLLVAGSVWAQSGASEPTGAASSSVARQAAAAKAAFEVASVHVSPVSDPQQVRAGLRMDGAQAHFVSLSLKNLISRAYDIQQALISGPDWISSVRYDIDAKLPDGATADQIPGMLQTLLAERLGLKIHREKKDVPAYALVVGKPPLRLQEETHAADPANPQAGVNVAVSGSAAGVSMDLGNGSSYTFANNQFTFTKVTMDEAAIQLARYLDRPVVNQTALPGQYTFTLPVTQEDYYILLVRVGANAGVTMPPQAMGLLNAGPPTSLFDSVEKLGLRMDSQKVAVDEIVVDQAQQTPTEN